MGTKTDDGGGFLQIQFKAVSGVCSKAIRALAAAPCTVKWGNR